MTGTLVNAAAVMAGGCLGLCIKRGLNERIQKSVTAMLGLATAIIGLNGVLAIMLRADVTTGKISSSGELLLLISLAVGAAIGEWMRIEDRLEQVGERIEKRLGASNFSKGFISASILFCVGAMTIIGSINDGLTGDSRVLFIKSTLDFIAAIIMASALGVGVPFAAITVLLYQGALTLCAGMLSTVLAGVLLDQVCMVGYAIVICIGINFFGILKIKTASLLPALFVPIVYNMLSLLKTLW
ncbi:MAG: DUF554 domain-containing protein [Angelakisella sp.]